ncbi:MAG: hypothetical protein ABSG33_06370 [Candidatus Bathyarchaeia archaeon]|jgi:hypothetical protein
MASWGKALAIILAIVILTTLVMTTSVAVKAQPKTIIVPDDYPTIQSAINHADAGDTVFVRDGLYNGTLIIDKQITLIGQDESSTILDAQKAKSQVILIEANNVTVANFTLGDSDFNPATNSGWYQENGEGDGILIAPGIAPAGPLYPSYINIINDTILSCPIYDIDTGLSVYDVIAGNTIIVNGFSAWRPFFSYGIRVGCLFSVIENNTLDAPQGYGIVFEYTCVTFGDSTLYLNESDTIQGNPYALTSNVPNPFPSIAPIPTASSTPLATPSRLPQSPSPSPSGSAAMAEGEVQNIIIIALVGVLTILIFTSLVYIRRLRRRRSKLKTLP